MILKTVKSVLFFGVFILFAISCQKERNTERAFYFWKSEFTANDTEKKLISGLRVKKIYINFFDVRWDKEAERPMPVSKIGFHNSALTWLKQSGIKIIPSIYISNEPLEKILPETVNKLGERIAVLLGRLLNDFAIDTVTEIQIDCDWTTATKDKYFELLNYLKMLPLFSSKQLSATIRLSQCKNYNQTGIPPVNRGMLMCFNMGNIKDPEAKNSILDVAKLKIIL